MAQVSVNDSILMESVNCITMLIRSMENRSGRLTYEESQIVFNAKLHQEVLKKNIIAAGGSLRPGE